jgi:phosphinothricin acetyltransferase
MIIRPAELDDVPTIVAIYNEAVLTTTATADEQPQALAHRQAWFRDHQRGGLPVLVAEIDGAVVGWGSLSRFHARPAYRFTVEDSVYVAADHRGRGVGRALLTPLVARAASLGMHNIMALIEAGNDASRRLHASLGFVECGLAPQVMFKFERWLDLLWMQRRL